MSEPTAAEIDVPPGELATLAIVFRFPEAAVLISMLRAYGIPAFAPAWGFATIYWHLTLAIGGIAVVVPARDLDAARVLVGESRDLPLPPRNVRGGMMWNALVALLLFVISGVPTPVRAKGSYRFARRRV